MLVGRGVVVGEARFGSFAILILYSEHGLYKEGRHFCKAAQISASLECADRIRASACAIILKTKPETRRAQ
jgi:hypothetical protein